MGTVYRALDTRLGRHVALKVIHGSLARDPEIAERPTSLYYLHLDPGLDPIRGDPRRERFLARFETGE